MKKIYIYITILLFSVSSCNVLDVDPTTKYSETTAYASIENLDLYVKGFYGIFYANADITTYLMNDGFTDLVKYSWYNMDQGQPNKYFYLSNYVTPESNLRSDWSDLYTRIRQFNEYFYDLNNGYASGLDQEKLAVRTAEVRFMRAFAYQELVTRYGGVILRIDEEHVDDQNEKAKARSSESECWDFIISEYKKAAKSLPLEWVDDSDENNVGRVTKGAAWGMIARAALYAERWDEALAACDEVDKIADQGYYELLKDYASIFTETNNKELILSVNFESQTKQHNFDLWFCPPADYNSQVGAIATPTDEFASQFDIQVDGTWQSFSWDLVNNKNVNPWLNRDPRFYSTILYNGASWKGRTIELFKGGEDGYMDYSNYSQDGIHKSTTGYLFRKFVKEDKTENFTTILSDQYWIEMRYAEIFLIRSEVYARENNFSKAYENLKVLRDRVSLPTLEQKNNWDDYLEDLQKERICELGLEGHRFFDLVRWGLAVETLNKSRVHGVKITKDSNSTFSYERVEADTQDRLFPEKYTIFPIPYTEIKNNSLCEQNDLWK